jgi:hypothetical protein
LNAHPFFFEETCHAHCSCIENPNYPTTLVVPEKFIIIATYPWRQLITSRNKVNLDDSTVWEFDNRWNITNPELYETQT